MTDEQKEEYRSVKEIKINPEIIKDSISHYGVECQTTVCMEECAELIQAVSKEKRCKGDKNHLAEEIADVYICLEMLRQIYGVKGYEIETWINKKQNRIVERMKEVEKDANQFFNLKKGDVINCEDEKDCVRKMTILQEFGIETDFLYENDGIKGLWLKVTKEEKK